MKKLLLASCTLYISISSIAQVPSSCDATEAFKALYKKDVEYLAMARMYQIQSPDTSLLLVPQSYQDTIMNGLAAIYNTGSQLEADSVFDWYCIHNTLPNDYLPYGQMPAFSVLDAKVPGDYDLAWTTNADMAALLASYDFEVFEGCCNASNYEYNWGWASLVSSQILNVHAFKDSLVHLNPMVYFRDFSDIWMMIDNIISYHRSGDTLRYRFRLGWGDCPAGCTSDKNWYYTVYPDCSVSLDSTNFWIMDAWPQGCLPLAITEAGNNQITFEVFPNPATSVINIKVASSLIDSCDYKLYNSNGQVILSGHLGNNTRLDLAHLPKGIYLLRLLSKTGNTGLQKIILQ